MLRKIFGRKKQLTPGENEVRIVLPEESYTVIEFKQDELPCVATVNSALPGFEHKAIFRWHLSVIIVFEDIIDNGMPSKEERDIVDPFCDQLDEEIKAGGNALFLVRETWDETRRLVWMVHDPEIANQHLQNLIKHERHPRPFQYRMEDDVEWREPEWYLDKIGK